jgi:hypothetical protein
MTSQNWFDMWERVMGDSPAMEQFAIWTEMHSEEAIKHGIIKTAVKNRQMGGTMSLDHREKFASKVMTVKDADLLRFKKDGAHETR